MSQENVDVLRAAFSAWNAEDMNSFRAGHASAPLHASPHDLIHRRGVFASTDADTDAPPVWCASSCWSEPVACIPGSGEIAYSRRPAASRA
jgi:hypothetical protein